MIQAMQAASYRIVVEGVIDPSWRECFDGLAVVEQRRPGGRVVTQLEGNLEDQSALQGVIATLFMLRMNLLFIVRLPEEEIAGSALA